MRCPDCNKFVGLEFADPEVERLEIDGDEVACEVRIVRNCAECGQELKEAQLELSAEIPQEVADAHDGDNHDLEVEETGVDPIEEGGGRYAKSYFGATVSFAVRCSCQKKDDAAIYEGEMSDKVAASAMDELV